MQLSTSRSGAVGAEISNTAAIHKGAITSAQAAQLTGANIMLRFTASGVTCSTYAFRTDLDSLWITQ